MRSYEKMFTRCGEDKNCSCRNTALQAMSGVAMTAISGAHISLTFQVYVLAQVTNRCTAPRSGISKLNAIMLLGWKRTPTSQLTNKHALEWRFLLCTLRNDHEG